MPENTVNLPRKGSSVLRNRVVSYLRPVACGTMCGW